MIDNGRSGRPIGVPPTLSDEATQTCYSTYFRDRTLEEDKYIDNDDLIYAWSASFGPFIWNGDRAIYHYHIWKVKFFLGDSPNKRFLYYFLLESTERIKAAGSGIAMIHMTKERMEKLIVPIPPPNEQLRIVAKLQELTFLCDKLEQQIDATVEKQSALLNATMAQIGGQRCA